jgi:hypothetical protein
MSTKKIIVNKKEFIQKFIINNINISIIDLDLGNSVNVACLLKENDTLVETKILIISGEEYKNWGNSDNYIENLVLNKLGLQRKQ